MLEKWDFDLESDAVDGDDVVGGVEEVREEIWVVCKEHEVF